MEFTARTKGNIQMIHILLDTSATITLGDISANLWAASIAFEAGFFRLEMENR